MGLRFAPEFRHEIVTRITRFLCAGIVCSVLLYANNRPVIFGSDLRFHIVGVDFGGGRVLFHPCSFLKGRLIRSA